MGGGLNGLIEYLLDEVALHGEQGALPSDILQYIDSYYEANANISDLPDSDPHNSAEFFDKPKIDRAFQEQVWVWLSKSSEIRVGRENQGNGFTLSEVESQISEEITRGRAAAASSATFCRPLLAPQTLQSPSGAWNVTVEFLTSDASAPNAVSSSPKGEISNQISLRVYTSQSRMWHAVAGHGPDYSRVPRLDFVCLSLIAAARSRGILQPDLVRLSGQDKRSVPRRTQLLHDRGYIVKRPCQVKRRRTSICTLKKFLKVESRLLARSELNQDSHSANETEFGPMHSESGVGVVIDSKTLLINIFDILRESTIITWDDLKRKIGVLGQAWQSRVLAVAIRRLESIGCVKRVQAAGNFSKPRRSYYRCVKLLRAPDERDCHAFFVTEREYAELSKARKRESANLLEEQDETLYMAADRQDIGNDELQEVPLQVSERAVPQWTPDQSFTNFVLDLVRHSGTMGISTMDLKHNGLGDFFERPMENQLDRLVEAWQLAQPPHLRHLAIVRDTAMSGKNSHYVHYTQENFKILVDSGKASWDAVSVVKKSKNENIAAEPFLDEYGFPTIPDSRFQGRSNDATLLECMEASGADAFPLTTYDPVEERRPDGSSVITYPLRNKRVRASRPLEKTRQKSHAKKIIVRNQPLRQRGRPQKNKKPAVPKKVDKTIPTSGPGIEAKPAWGKHLRPKNGNGDMNSKQIMNTTEESDHPQLADNENHRAAISLGALEQASTGTMAERSPNNTILSKPTAIESSTLTSDPKAQEQYAPATPSNKRALKKMPLVVNEGQGITSKKERVSRDGDFTAASHAQLAACIEISGVGVFVGDTSRLRTGSQGRPPRTRLAIFRLPSLVQFLWFVRNAASSSEAHSPTPLEYELVEPNPISNPEVALHAAEKINNQSLPETPPFTLTYLDDTIQNPDNIPPEHTAPHLSSPSIANRKRKRASSLSTRVVEDIGKRNYQESRFNKTPTATKRPRLQSQLPDKMPENLRQPDQPASKEQGLFLDADQTENTHQLYQHNIDIAERASTKFTAGRPKEIQISHDVTIDASGQSFRPSQVGTPTFQESVNNSPNIRSRFSPFQNQSIDPQASTEVAESAHLGQPKNQQKSRNGTPTTHKTKSIHGTPKIKAAAKLTKLNPSGGSVAILRREILMDIVEKCGGICPSDKELWYPFTTAWMRRNQTRNKPDTKTIKTAIKALMESGKVRQIKFCFSNKRGVTVTKNILTLPEIKPDSAIVKEIQQRIIERDPKLYIPEGLEIDDELTQSHSSNFSPIKQKRVPDLEVDEETEVQLQYVPPYVMRANMKKFGRPEEHQEASPAAQDSTITPGKTPRAKQKHKLRNESFEPPISKPHLSSKGHKVVESPEIDVFTGATASRPKSPSSRHPYGQRKVERLARIGRNSLPTQLRLPVSSRTFTSPIRPTLYIVDETYKLISSNEYWLPPPLQVFFLEPLNLDSNFEEIEDFKEINLDLMITENPAKYYNLLFPAFDDPQESGVGKVSSAIKHRSSSSATLQGRKQMLNLLNGHQIFHRTTGTYATVFRSSSYHLEGNQSNGQRHQELILPHSLDNLLSQIRAGSLSHRSDLEKAALSPFEMIVEDVQRWELSSSVLSHSVPVGLHFINHTMRNSPQSLFSSTGDFSTFEASQSTRPFRDLNPNIQPYWTSSQSPPIPLTRDVLNNSTPNLYFPKWAPLPTKGSTASAKTKNHAGPSSLKRRRLSSVGEAFTAGASAEVVAGAMPTKKVKHRSAKVSEYFGKALEMRLLTAVVIVRILIGGLEKNINWTVVSQLFHPRFDEEEIRLRWIGVRGKFKLQIDKMEADFQEMFAQAYEEERVPPIDYDHVEDYDWPWVLDWTQRNLNQEPKTFNAVPALPATRAQLDSLYILQPVHEEDMSEYFEFNNNTMIKRRAILSSRPFVRPLFTESTESPRTDRANMELAKTWIRANIVTLPNAYNADVATAKLLPLGEAILEAALNELLSLRILTHVNKGRLVPGRNYDISEYFISRLQKTLRVFHFRKAAAFKAQLDAEFAANGKVEFSYHADDGTMVAYMNLVACKRVTIKAVDPPMDSFGLTDGGYRTRIMDRRRLGFRIEIRPAETYVVGNPLAPISEPPSEHLRDEGAKIPMWYDIHGGFVPALWELALAAVVSIVAMRPGVAVAEVERNVRPSLGDWEIELIVQWLIKIGAVMRGKDGDRGGLVALEWWWLCVTGEDGGEEGLEERDGELKEYALTWTGEEDSERISDVRRGKRAEGDF